MCIFKTIYSSLNYFRRKVNEVEAEENEKRNDTEKLRKEKKKNTLLHAGMYY